MDRFRPVLILIALTTAVFAGPVLAAPQGPPPQTRYAPPEATFNAGNQLQVLQVEIDQKNYADAAARFDALLRDSGDGMMSPAEDGSENSVTAWFAALPPDQLKQIAPAWEAYSGQAASQALDDLRAKPGSEPADFYAVARRYPLSVTAGSALATAAQRAAALGDVPTAKWMLTAAIAKGFVPDDSLKQLLEAQESPEASTPVSPVPTPLNQYQGPLPFDAGWYYQPTRDAWVSLRSFPIGAAGMVFVQAPGQVIAIKDTGGIVWQGPVGEEPPPGKGVSSLLGPIRGPALMPTLFSDVAGTPQLLVVRQPEVHGDGWALRALRASDGKLLWTTEGRDEYRGLVFGSNPAIEGRYVYAIAGDPGEQVDRLCMVALELTSGRQLWRCDLGTEARTLLHAKKADPPPQAYRPWLNESSPRVSGEFVIAAPDIGATVVVERFDGKLRWARLYPTLSDPTIPPGGKVHNPMNGNKIRKDKPKLQPGISMRYANMPAIAGQTIVIAPQDSDSVFGLNLADGKVLWEMPDLSDATLVGISGDVAVMAGQTVSGLKLGTGQIAWSNDDLTNTVIGPPILHDTTVYVPTATGMTTLAAADGTAATASPKIPVLKTIFAFEPARAALSATDVDKCFGVAPEPPLSPAAKKQQDRERAKKNQK